MLISQAFLSLIGHQLCNLNEAQLYLPASSGGLGLSQLTASDDVVCCAAFLSAAHLTQQATEGRAVIFQPFLRVAGGSLQECWEQV
jgi:hypothetical protein